MTGRALTKSNANILAFWGELCYNVISHWGLSGRVSGRQLRLETGNPVMGPFDMSRFWTHCATYVSTGLIDARQVIPRLPLYSVSMYLGHWIATGLGGGRT